MALFRILPPLRYHHALREVGRSELWIPACAGKTKGEIASWIRVPGLDKETRFPRRAFRTLASTFAGAGSARDAQRDEEFWSSCYLIYKLIDTLLGRKRWGKRVMPLHQRRIKSWFGVVLALVAFMLFIGSFRVHAQKPVVYVAPIEGVIDLGLAPFVQRVLEEAAMAKASAVILNINTFGGRVDAAVLIRDALLESKIMTVAFINKRAISAGALISLATEKIAMADGGTIGAATPVQIGLPGAPAQPVAEKTVSYMRKEFRATAEQRNRPTLIAEAMVDADVEIPDIILKGKLLTLTTKEALDVKVADFQANTLEAVLQSLELDDAEIRHASETWAETLVRFLTHPVVSSLLMTLGIMGIIIEIRVPGFGLPGLTGLVSLGLFFWGHTLVQLAGLEEFLLVSLGLILVAMEIFFIPGFGIAGIFGILALMGGLGLSLIGSGATWDSTLSALGQVALSILIAILVALFLLRYFQRLPFGKRLLLKTSLLSKEGYASSPEEDQRWLGKRGTAATDLHPSGIAHLNGDRLDVVSDGDFINAGQPVEVVRVDGNRIVVRVLTEPAEGGHA